MKGCPAGRWSSIWPAQCRREKYSRRSAAHTTEGKLDGKTYRRGMDFADFSIFRADDRTLLLATTSTDLLERMVHNHAKPKEGPLANVLSHVADPPDAMMICLVPRMQLGNQ